MIRPELTIEGLQEAQDLNLRVIAAFEPGGAASRAIKEMTIKAHRYLVSITHVDTGAYKGSHRMKLTDIRGEIQVEAGALNPRTGKLVTSYSVVEEARGGSHAAYQRTIDEVGDIVTDEGVRIILRSLE